MSVPGSVPVTEMRFLFDYDNFSKPMATNSENLPNEYSINTQAKEISIKSKANKEKFQRDKEDEINQFKSAIQRLENKNKERAKRNMELSTRHSRFGGNYGFKRICDNTWKVVSRVDKKIIMNETVGQRKKKRYARAGSMIGKNPITDIRHIEK